MKKISKESNTRKCLMKSFAGESMARNRYTFFSKIADKEGLKQIAEYFKETAENERAHAKRFYGFLGEEFDEELIIEAGYPIGINKTTLLNLEFSMKGEHEENTYLYPSFEKIAREEGYDEVADNYCEIIKVEKVHEERFADLMENIKSGRVFKRESDIIWKCRNCGYHFIGKEAPENCPACKHPKSYFEIFVKNY